MKSSLIAAVMVGSIISTTLLAQMQPSFGPDPVNTSSDIKVKAEYIGRMPFVLGPGLTRGADGNPINVQNIGSPVAIGRDLYFIDQNDGILRYESTGNNGVAEVETIFSVRRGDGPAGLNLVNRQAVMNISAGSDDDSIYVMFSAVRDSVLPNVPHYEMPMPLSEFCCFFQKLLPDVYDVIDADMAGTQFSFFVFPGLEYQVLYEAKLEADRISMWRAIAIFDAHGGPTHHGGGMLTLPDGRILYVTGDGLPFGMSGRNSAQDTGSHLSKLIIIDPADGSIEIAAVGARNVQHLEFTKAKGKSENRYVGFADIGGWTAEEINFVSLTDLLDTSEVENLGWGTNPDGLAREGTFYVGPGQAFTFGTPPVESVAPTPEPGFIQPYAQYERPANGDPNGGLASTGPVTSKRSLKQLTSLFSDLDSGILYGTKGGFDEIATTIFKLGILDSDGILYSSLEELAGLDRVDPRFFRFPDGTAGVLFEANGDFYRLTEVQGKGK